MDQTLTYIQTHNIPQIVCISTQLIITFHTVYNLHKHKLQFPVKQLSPLLSLTALISFILINCISLTAKLIQTNNQYYKPNYHPSPSTQQLSCGQCRLYNNPQMIILSVIYNGLRQLPLIIFIIKTYRVCLCYNIPYQKQLSHSTIWLFSSEKRLLYLSIFITLILTVIGYFVFGQGNQHYGYLVFEFMCPKQSGIYDWILIAMRFVAMAYVYTISIYTYNELDFKRFLIFIFILTNTQVLLRLFLAMADITKKTYHQFYYHSLIMNLFGTLIMLYYSTIKQQRNQPLTLPILQSFKTFLQSTLGYTMMTYFAQDMDDDLQQSNKKYSRIFSAYISLQQINMIAYYNNFKIKPQSLPRLIQILSIQSISQLIDNSRYLLQRCIQKQISSIQLRELQVKLERYCQRHVFNQWRNTQSSKYLQMEFKNNGVINLRMDYLGIRLK